MSFKDSEQEQAIESFRKTYDLAKGSFSNAERNAIAKELEKLRRGDDDLKSSKWRYIYNLVNPKDGL